jgi:hypothetical protein
VFGARSAAYIRRSDRVTEPMMEEVLVFVGLMASLSVTGKIILALIQRRRAVPGSDFAALEEIRARLTRIEQVTESTAVEVERIGEGQRFTTRLLSEKHTSTPA